MITVSEKSRLALSALVELARRSTAAPVPLVEVAGAREIPLHVVEQLFGALRRAGILQSQRGVKGGYSFRRAPAEVAVIEVVEVVDGRIGLATDGDAAGPGDWVWVEAAAALVGALDELTIADIAEREVHESSAPMFHI